jgi:hypothetical protein
LLAAIDKLWAKGLIRTATPVGRARSDDIDDLRRLEPRTYGLPHGVSPMRFLLYLIVCAVALWLGDMYFYHGRYRNELWRDMQYQARKIEYDVRRAMGL